MKKTTDIQSYTGLIHFTNPKNIYSILQTGLTTDVNKIDQKILTGFETRNIGNTQSMPLWFSRKGPESTFENWDSLPWVYYMNQDDEHPTSIGSLCLLFNTSTIPSVDFNLRRDYERKDCCSLKGYLLEHNDSIQPKNCGSEEFTVRSKQTEEGSYIHVTFPLPIGIVLSPYPSYDYKISKRIETEAIREETIASLNSVQDDPNKKIPPLYNCYGETIWSKKDSKKPTLVSQALKEGIEI
ncbi:hypothetical protein CL622_03425 [archaeon]|nr:hypothetical protein [archaeon]|tara:strand:+ start:562 stop:1281 length:720 start_codon:yes stop_codon:yes gene_type:complete